MILATDLDRTLLPNGHEAFDQDSMKDFFSSLNRENDALMYVSGRNLDLLHNAVSEYGIELPDFFIGEVGTVIYELSGDELKRFEAWDDHILSTNPDWDRKTIESLLSKQKSIELQEGWKNNRFKISYYLRDESLQASVLSDIHAALDEQEIQAEVIYSYDPLASVGLIDILPSNVSKLAAIEFVREHLELEKDDVVYCGDSGNDVLPLTSGYKAIVVNNASDEFKKDILRLAKDKNIEHKIYFASGDQFYNGNYVAGIIEGLAFFSKQS